MATADSFRMTIQQILRARSQLEKRHARRGTPNTTRSFAVQGLYLLGIRAFESYLEEQILNLATGESTWAARVIDGVSHVCVPRLRENRRDLLIEIVFRNRAYATYLPYRNTQDLAKFLFEGGAPFTSLAIAEKQILSRCSKVRNFIAHNSASARAEFVEEATKIAAFRRTPRRVIDYLDLGMRAGVTYFEHDITTLVRVANFPSA